LGEAAATDPSHPITLHPVKRAYQQADEVTSHDEFDQSLPDEFA
jgi:hypothetical protein